jgi:hypothetical protein
MPAEPALAEQEPYAAAEMPSGKVSAVDEPAAGGPPKQET